MLRNCWQGAVAGAAGTVALDLATYTDMAVRGRAPSSMTRTVVQRLAGQLGIGALASAEPDEATGNRQDAVGAILGYVTGIAAGAVYGAVREPFASWIPAPLAGLVCGLAAMAVTDGTAVALEATDIGTWDAASWLSDLIPHAIFGVVTAQTFAALDGF